MSTYNKKNELIDPKTEKPLATKRHSNIPAYLIATIIVGILITGGVMYASEKLSNFLTSEFSYGVTPVNLK